MLWVFLAIAAHFCWALVNVGDKYVVANRVKSPYVYMVWLAILGIFAAALIPFIDFVVPDIKILLWLLLAAAAYLFGGFPYIRAIQLEEITRINIWWNLIPIFSFILAWLFIGEKLTSNQIIAFIILIIGAVLASIHIQKKVIVFSKALGLMVVAGLAFAIYGVILRYVTDSMPFLSVFVWVNLLIVVLVPVIFLIKKFRQDFFHDIKKLNKGLVATVASISLLDTIGLLFNVWALSLGSVALVFAMEGWQVIFVFAIVLLISIFNPKLLKEGLDVSNVVLKLTALIVIIIGVVMVYLN